MLIEAEDEEYDADDVHDAQMDFTFEGRQMHQMEQVYVCFCLAVHNAPAQSARRTISQAQVHHRSI